MKSFEQILIVPLLFKVQLAVEKQRLPCTESPILFTIYAKYFQPEQLMLLAQNNMFIGHIADALLDLGVEKIRQTTYVDYVRLCIGKKVKMVNLLKN